MAHLVSKRAAARSTTHFTTGTSEGAPENFVPHPEPLALHWGMPNDGFFPVDSIDVTLVDYPFQKSLSLPVTNASLESLALGSESNGQTLTPPYKKNNVITINRRTDNKALIDLATGLQYSQTEGIPQVRQFARDLVKRVHKPVTPGWDAIITLGAGDGLNKAAEVLLDRDDVVLIEEFTFSPFLQNVELAGGIPVPIKLDVEQGSEGLNLEYLTDLLENWETLKPGLRKPKALYTIATGQNPTGLTQTLGFRKKVYALAEKHDFAIIEDDPYGYLTLSPYKKPEAFIRLNDFISVDDYVNKELTPSYVSIDTSGRVVRLETFSKLFAPGLRLGFIVANDAFIMAIANYSALVTRFPSGPSQILFNNVVEQKFGGVDGWLQWVLKMRVTYSHRKDVLLQSLVESKAHDKKYLEVIDPLAGMFAVVKINFPEGVDIASKIKVLNFKLANYGVGAVPGINMAVDKEFSKDKGNFYRLTFAAAKDDGQLSEAGTRFSNAVYDFFEKGLEY